MDCFFKDVREYPTPGASGVVVRLIDGLGYRFYWATDGLSSADLAFTPGQGCMTIGKLIEHIWSLANRGAVSAGEPTMEDKRAESPAEQRNQALEILLALRKRIAAMSEEDLFKITVNKLPFWHMINGSLSDAIAHTGQIASFRRLNGNPVPKHSPLLCHAKDA